MTPTIPDFFTPISNTKPYFKAAFEGFAGCLSGDTIIPVNHAGKGAQYTIKGLYKRFVGIHKNKNGSVYDTSIPTNARSLKGDRIGLNQIVDIYQSGKKVVYLLKASEGYEIKATEEHKFLIQEKDGATRTWKKLCDLQPKDHLIINGDTLDKD